MNLNKIIEKVVAEDKLEKLIEEKLAKGIDKALDDLFGNYGDVTKIIKEKLKDVMIPHVEAYDYGSYVTKMDAVIAKLLKSAAPEYSKMIKNFEEFTQDIGVKPFDTINLSVIFKAYNELVAKEVDTNDLEIDWDDDPTYESVETFMETETIDGYSYDTTHVKFGCEKDESLQFEIELWGSNVEDKWLRILNKRDVSGVLSLRGFDIYLLKLDQMSVKVRIDETELCEDVMPEDRPEPSYQ